VREWLQTLAALDRRTIGQDIATAEFGWPVGMPLSRSLGSGLFEIRSDISHGRAARVIFAVVNERMVLLHAVVKKSQKLHHADRKLALQRLKELLT